MNANVLIASASNCLRKGGNVVLLYVLVTMPVNELPFSPALYLCAGFYFFFILRIDYVTVRSDVLDTITRVSNYYNVEQVTQVSNDH